MQVFLWRWVHKMIGIVLLSIPILSLVGSIIYYVVALWRTWKESSADNMSKREILFQNEVDPPNDNEVDCMKFQGQRTKIWLFVEILIKLFPLVYLFIVRWRTKNEQFLDNYLIAMAMLFGMLPQISILLKDFRKSEIFKRYSLKLSTRIIAVALTLLSGCISIVLYSNVFDLFFDGSNIRYFLWIPLVGLIMFPTLNYIINTKN